MDKKIDSVVNAFRQLQDVILHELEAFDGATFHTDEWFDKYSKGKTTILEEGKYIERAGVNFSLVEGDSLPDAASKKLDIKGSFVASGLSLIVHPINPYAPTAHANIRFFCSEDTWWFGGGYDLTPCYGFDEDCRHWHGVAKTACDKFDTAWYSEFKKNCDEYFFLKHREESRGIGGIFFDDFSRLPFAQSLEFAQTVGRSFLDAYMPIFTKRVDIPYTDQNRAFQQFRRSRYVEFNLVQDRGTLFGLQYGGKIESILASMPLHASWRYNYTPRKDSAEEELYQRYLKPQEWANA